MLLNALHGFCGADDASALIVALTFSREGAPEGFVPSDVRTTQTNTLHYCRRLVAVRDAVWRRLDCASKARALLAQEMAPVL